jgi:hypothetical protein
MPENEQLEQQLTVPDGWIYGSDGFSWKMGGAKTQNVLGKIHYKYEKCTIHLTMMEHMKNGFIITFPIETTTSGLLHHFHEHPKSQFVG